MPQGVLFNATVAQAIKQARRDSWTALEVLDHQAKIVKHLASTERHRALVPLTVREQNGFPPLLNKIVHKLGMRAILGEIILHATAPVSWILIGGGMIWITHAHKGGPSDV